MYLLPCIYLYMRIQVYIQSRPHVPRKKTHMATQTGIRWSVRAGVSPGTDSNATGGTTPGIWHVLNCESNKVM